MKNKAKRAETIAAGLFLLPEMAVMLVFVFIPMIYALYLSFIKWNGFQKDRSFVALENYELIFKNHEFWASIKVTFIYMAAYVTLLFLLSLALALLNHSVKSKAGQLYRTLIFTPHAVSLVIAGVIWTFMFSAPKGYINQLIGLFGIKPQAFLGSRSQALGCVIVISLWIAAGYYMIIFTAALKEIPMSLYEAAALDGAGVFQKFWYITLPGLKDTSIFVFVVSTIGALQLFEPVQILTSGGPAKATNVIVKYIYDTAFQLHDMGGASAAAFILFVIIMLLTITQLKITKMEI
ncbi:MAG: sugar ABC transporter permease [Hungatella sp.]|nr:sugar ABC transporter permease [Hungatella sp.]